MNRRARRRVAASRRSLLMGLVLITSLGVASVLYVNRDRTLAELPSPPSAEMLGVAELDPAVVMAINEARQKILDDPSSSEAWSHLGMVFGAHGFDAPAAVCFSSASRLDPTNQRWAYLCARCTLSSSPEEGMKMLEKCVELPGDPNDTSRLFLIEKLLESHRLDDAEQHLKVSLQRNPKNARARFTKARLLFLREEYQACKDEIVAAQLEIKETYVAATERAQTLVKQGKASEAKEVLRVATENTQRSLCRQKTIGQMLSSALLRLGEQEASRRQQDLASRQPDTPWLDPYTRGIVELKTGLRALLSQADRLHGQGRFSEALEVADEAAARYPDSDFARIRLARSHFHLGRKSQIQRDTKQAVSHFQQAREQLTATLQLDERSVEAHFRFGVLLLYWSLIDKDLKQLSDAESWFRKAIAIKPDFDMAHFNLGKCLSMQKRMPEALAAMRDALRFDPNNLDARRGLGGLLMKTGKLSEAVAEFETYLEAKPDDRQVHKWVQIMKRDLSLK